MELQKPVSRDRRKRITLTIGCVVISLVSGGSVFYLYQNKLSEAKQDTEIVVEDFERSLVVLNESISKEGKIKETKLELGMEDFDRLKKKYSEDVSIFIIDDAGEVKWEHNRLEIDRDHLPEMYDGKFRGTVNAYANGGKFKVYRLYKASRNLPSYHHDVMLSWTSYLEQWAFSVIVVIFCSMVGLAFLLEIEKFRTRRKRYDAILDQLLERAHVFTKDAPNWPNNFRNAAHDIKGHISNLLDSVEQVCKDARPDRWEIVREKFEKVDSDIDFLFTELWHKLKHEDTSSIDIVERCKAMLEPNRQTGIVPVLRRISSRKEFQDREFPEGFLTLRHEGVPDSLYVNFDEKLFNIVLDELLLNAARAADTKVVVTVEQDKTESRIARIVVENDGERFPAEGRKGLLLLGGKRHRKNMDNTTGGMGLPSVRHIVCDFFGDLLLEDSIELGGARVILEIPLIDGNRDDVAVK